LGTKTWKFGTPSKCGYDSTEFYRRKLYSHVSLKSNVTYVENQIAPEVIDRIFLHTSEFMPHLPDNSVHLVVTSPPYNVGKEYDEDMTLDEYMAFLHRVFKEVYRVLVPGGRVAVNIAGIGRKPYIPLHHMVASLLRSIGFLMRGGNYMA